ncbi:MAG: metalloprotease family protein [Verrucomicrobiaceae bacterium]
MIIIPGFVISILTFPGVIVHEAAHQLMCRLTGTPVLNVCYFRVGNPAGFVIHDAPSTGWKHFLIAVAPFLINTIAGMLIALPAGLAVAGKGEPGPLDVTLGWLGISVAMHAFPSTGDASSLWHSIRAPGASWLLRIIGFPVVAVIYLGAALSVVWFDAIYAALICFAVPAAVVEALA